MSSYPLNTQSSGMAGSWGIRGKNFYTPDGEKVVLRGVTYGPFAPSGDGPWPIEDVIRADISRIRSLKFNIIRVYELPNAALLEACRQQGIRIMVGIPWTQHVDFLGEAEIKRDAVRRVREAARRFADDDTVVALLVGNEIEKTLVRWLGPEKVRAFLEKLIAVARTEAPDKPVAYANYPSSEYLFPRNAAFAAFNVFLEKQETFAAYLAHLQSIVGDKPLVISEFGIDTKHHGESFQAEARYWMGAECWKAGVAGAFWFAYTDEWHRGGAEVTGWDFGLVTRDRLEKLACTVPFYEPETPPAATSPKISVVVCTRNGSATLRGCLQALTEQTLTPHEVLIIDDGSTDTVPEIAREFPAFQYHYQQHAGLSVARNRGCHLATGDIIAYTDDDCLPDREWLLHLSLAYDDPCWVAAGGPNLPPPPRNLTEACVAAAPGAPAVVLLNATEAEHLPGCNLSIRKDALEAIGGFRDEFMTAGDDVDVCWRLQETGARLRFVPAAVVWHHRRFTVKAYVRQQQGYGKAEAMLIKAYPNRFAWFSGARWRGAIYGDTGGNAPLRDQSIHFGRFGLAPFQCVYAGWETGFWSWMKGLLWLTAVVLLACSSSVLPVLWLPSLTLLTVGLIAAQRRAGSYDDSLKNRPTLKQRLLLWFLCFLQPIVRDWARLKWMVNLKAWPQGRWTWGFDDEEPDSPQNAWDKQITLWSHTGVCREQLLEQLQATAAEWKVHLAETPLNSFWDLDLRVAGKRWRLTSVTEYHQDQQRLTRIALRRGRRAPWLRYFTGRDEETVLVRWILQAADHLGMVSQQLNQPDSGPDRTVSLASTRQNVEV